MIEGMIEIRIPAPTFPSISIHHYPYVNIVVCIFLVGKVLN